MMALLVEHERGAPGKLVLATWRKEYFTTPYKIYYYQIHATNRRKEYNIHRLSSLNYSPVKEIHPVLYNQFTKLVLSGSTRG